MKCLCVRQPWAWAIASGLKKIENRTWSVSYRGDLAIHTSRSMDEFDRGSSRVFSAMMPGLPPVSQLIFGAVVAVVRLVDIVPASQVRGQPFASDSGWCWILDDVRRVEPISFRGSQGLFEVPDLMVEEALRKVWIGGGAGGATGLKAG